MRTKIMTGQKRKTAIGNGLYGRQWYVKDSNTLRFHTLETSKIFWPVYCL